MKDVSPSSAKTENKTAARAATTPAAEPRHPFLSLREEMDRLYDEFFSDFPLMPFGRRRMLAEARHSPQGLIGSTVAPNVDVVERDGEYSISAELPGMEEKDIEVSIANGVLTVRGEKKQEREEKKENYYISERRFGSLQRSFRLPENVDADKIDAHFKNGVLTLTLPKNPGTEQAKKIAVKSA